MEIERKFLIKKIPFELSGYKRLQIEQAYLCTKPVVRIRKSNDEYYLTYKGSGKIAREEYNLPLNEEAYLHLREKADGNIITKTRYEIPTDDGLLIELDIFSGKFEGLILAEVEFNTLDAANAYNPPEWFGRDVSITGEFQNSKLSRMEKIIDFE